MKPPPWYEVNQQDTTHFVIRVRKWHPGFWLFVVRSLVTQRRRRACMDRAVSPDHR